MQLILTEDVNKLGKAGDVVKVKPGYGRNFLLPQHKAILANASNLKAIEIQKAAVAAQSEKKLDHAKAVAKKISGLEVTIEKDAGQGERLFGSVTKMEIVAALGKQGVQVDKHRLELATPIKEIGTYDISIKLHSEVDAAFKLWVVRKKAKGD